MIFLTVQEMRRSVELYDANVLTQRELQGRFLWAVNWNPNLVEDYFLLLPEDIISHVWTLIGKNDIEWFQTLGTGLHADMKWFRHPPREDIESRLVSRDALRNYLKWVSVEDSFASDRFAKRIDVARRISLTPTEIIYDFLEYAAYNPVDIPEFYRLLPSDLTLKLKSLVNLPLEEWCSRVWLTDAATLQTRLRMFLKVDAESIENSRPLNYSPRVRDTGSCPFCGKLLRTSKAKQCRFCKMDWHDPANIYCRA